eukprot:3326621-Pleurochrysis_carterae.AAC.1
MIAPRECYIRYNILFTCHTTRHSSEKGANRVARPLQVVRTVTSTFAHRARSSPGAAHPIKTVGGATQALLAASRAVQGAQQTYNIVERYRRGRSSPRPATYSRWTGWAGSVYAGALSLFKLGDGRFIYTDGRDVARSRPT